MSFWREPFNEIVKQQLYRRTLIHLEGRNISIQGEEEGSKTRSNDWYQYMVARTAFMRVSPLVIIKDEETLKGFDKNDFSKNFVLEGVPLIQDYESEGSLKKIFKKAPQFPSNPRSDGNMNSLLNNPILRTKPDEDGFGIVPPPGVMSFSTQTKSFYGNVRAAKITIRVFSLQQLNIIEKLYSRPGHHILVEWGWDKYSDFNLSKSQGKTTIKGVHSLISDLNYSRKETFDFWGESINAGELQREIAYLRNEYQSNYDGMLGIIDSFNTQIEKDGGYTVEVSLISRSELMNSLKLDTKSSNQPMFYDGNTAKTHDKFTALNTNFKPGNEGVTLEYTELPKKYNAAGKDVTLDPDEGSIPPPTLSTLRQYIRGATFNAINTSCGGIKDEDSEGTVERAAESGWLVSALIGIAAVVFIVATAGVGAIIIAGASAIASAIVLATAITLAVQFSGLGGYLTLDWTEGLSEDMKDSLLVDIEFSKVFRPYVDWILMRDANDQNAVAWDPVNGESVQDDQKDHSEIGLGPYIRLGTLLRFINHHVIPQNDKNQPLLYCTNNSFAEDFKPNLSNYDPDTSPYSLYPNSYSVHPLEYYYPILFKLLTAEVVGTEYDITKLEGILPKEFWDNYDDGKQTSVPVTPTVKIEDLDEQLRDSAHTAGGHSNYFYGVGYYDYLDMWNYCQNVRSALPSKVIFPHEFRKIQEDDWGKYSLVTKKADQNQCTYKQIQHSLGTPEEKADAIEEDGFPIRESHWWDFLETKEVDPQGYKKGAIPLYYILEGFETTDDSTYFNGSDKNGGAEELLASISYRDNIRYLANNGIIPKAFVNKIFKHIKEIGWEKFISNLHTKNKSYDKVRNIDNIMVNLFYLDSFLKDNEDVTLNNFLKEICDTCNKAMGDAIELKVVTNPLYTEMISIQDMRVSAYKSAKDKSRYFEFPKVGYGSLYKKLNVKGKIPSSMAASIAIAAQDPKDAGSIEQITYKNFLQDIEDRVIRNLKTKTKAELKEEKDSALEKHKELIKAFLRDLMLLRGFYKKGMHIDAPHLEKGWFTEAEGEAPSSLKMLLETSNKLFSRIIVKGDDEQGNKISKLYTYTSPLPYGSIIPLEVSFTLEGISGIFTANCFKMQKGTLPLQYNTNNVVFLVNGVKESIKGLTWSTDVKAQLIIINERAAPPYSILDKSNSSSLDKDFGLATVKYNGPTHYI